MSFSYDFDAYPQIANVRLLVGDTDAAKPIWSDAEVNAALQAESSQNVTVGLSGYCPAVPVKMVYPYRRAAAWLLNGLAANRSRLATVVQILDVRLAPDKAAASLRDQAQALIDQEANAGYFAVAEMVVDQFSMRERLYAMALRQNN